jgi:hypothetical protein
VAEDLALLDTGPAFVHVQVRPADVGRRNLDDRVTGRLDARLRHFLHGHLERRLVNDCLHEFLPSGYGLSPNLRAEQARERPPALWVGVVLGHVIPPIGGDLDTKPPGYPPRGD